MTTSTSSRSSARRPLEDIPLPDRAFFRGMFTHYRRLLRFVRPYWKLLALAGVILVINSLAGLALPLVIRNVVDSALVQASLRMLNRVTWLLLGALRFRRLFWASGRRTSWAGWANGW